MCTGGLLFVILLQLWLVSCKTLTGKQSDLFVSQCMYACLCFVHRPTYQMTSMFSFGLTSTLQSIPADECRGSSRGDAYFLVASSQPLANTTMGDSVSLLFALKRHASSVDPCGDIILTLADKWMSQSGQ